MDNKIKTVINLNKGHLKFYACLKYLVTPFSELDSRIPKKCRLLDIGCGYGVYSIYFALKSERRTISGIDKNPKKINYADKISKGCRNVNFNVLDLDKNYALPEADVYLINDVLHHINNMSKEILLKKISDKMKKNNILLIKEMHSGSKIKFFLNCINDKIMTFNKKLYFIEKERLLSSFKKLGLKVRHYKLNNYIFPHIIYICKK
ncbi:methyltransferase domain-containing protein [Candidatus Woesearchaeota archaeon]|nr:methyltransferase domain-containing protein [Candidatus Woesearchaeota archaeon]